MYISTYRDFDARLGDVDGGERTRIFTSTFTYMCLYTFIRTHVYEYMYTYIYIYVCIYKHMYMYISKYRDFDARLGNVDGHVARARRIRHKHLMGFD